jgi:ribulose-phosphate 3-epimerase
VNPGFGGQAYLSTMEPKMAAVRAMIDGAGLAGEVDLEIDGGVTPDTITGAAKSGVNVFVAGSSLFRDPLGPSHAVEELRELAAAARA